MNIKETIKTKIKEIKKIKVKLYHEDSLNKKNTIDLNKWFEIYSNQLKELDFLVHMEPENLTEDCLDNIEEIAVEILKLLEKVEKEKQEHIEKINENKNYFTIEKQVKKEWDIINDQCLYNIPTNHPDSIEKIISNKCNNLKHGIYRISTKEGTIITFKKLIKGGITFDLNPTLYYISQEKYLGI